MNKNVLEEAKKHAKQLQKEADQIMEKYNIVDILSKYGEVRFDGSYKTGLMVKPDVDIELYNTEMTHEKVYKLGLDLFHAFPRFYLSDRTRLPPQEGRPNGIYVGFIAEENDNRWTFDIWALKTEEDGQAGSTPGLEKSNWIDKATEEQKDTMLYLKYFLYEKGVYGKDVLSFHVYRAVLEGVKTLEEFKKWVIRTYEIELDIND